MFKFVAGTAIALSLAFPALAEIQPFPPSFKAKDMPAQDTTLHVVVGGKGPAVVLLHGFGDTGAMWSPLAARLAANHTVIVPDLRGMGLSGHPEGGYDKWNQAGDIEAVLKQLGINRATVVGHDIGTMVAFAYAARYPDRTERLVVMDAPVPGVGPWDQILRNPLLWHFNFGGPDAERLVAGRERIYLDRFWNEFAANPAKVDEASRNYYAKLYARPGAMRAAFAQFRSFSKDEEDNRKAVAAKKLPMPVLAIGGAKSFGANEAAVMRHAAPNVTEVVIPDAGHWLMEEAPDATMAAIQGFIK